MRGRRARVRGVLGPARRLARDRRGRHLRPHRHQRLGQEHAAQVPGPDPRARRGHASHTRGKVSALLELGAGFHPELSGRENVYLNGSILGLSKRGARPPLRRDRRASPGLERFIDTPGEELLVGHVRAARLLGRHQRRPRHPPRRRGAGRRRRAVPAPVQRAVRRPAGRGQDDRGRVALARRRCRRSATRSRGSTTACSGPSGRPATSSTSTSPRCTTTASAEDARHAGRGGARGRFASTGSSCSTRDGRPTDDVRTGERGHVPAPLRRRASRSSDPCSRWRSTPSRACCVTEPEHPRGRARSRTSIEGEGTVDLVVDPLPLLPGTYDLSAPSPTTPSLHVYDSPPPRLRFDVEPGDPRESFGGVLSLHGRWQHELDVSSPLLDGC